MATIKSFTDISQSRKLAEILPIESADMRYAPFGDTHPWVWDDNLLERGAIPCWSLAALLSVIPYDVSISRAVYRFKLVKFYDHWECYHENFGRVSTEIFKAKEAIDAVYAMILELHELKLLLL